MERNLIEGEESVSEILDEYKYLKKQASIEYPNFAGLEEEVIGHCDLIRDVSSLINNKRASLKDIDIENIVSNLNSASNEITNIFNVVSNEIHNSIRLKANHYKANHTKGKWRSSLANVLDIVCEKSNGESVIICSVNYNDSVLFEQATDNAKLIAIAPELLEALKVCYASLCTYGSHPIIEKHVENVLTRAK